MQEILICHTQSQKKSDFLAPSGHKAKRSLTETTLEITNPHKK